MASRHQMRELSSHHWVRVPGTLENPMPCLYLVEGLSQCHTRRWFQFLFIYFLWIKSSLPDEGIRPPLCLLDRERTVDGDPLILSWACSHWCPCRAMDFKSSTQAMKNVGPDAIHNVTSTYTLDSWNTYSYTWNVTFSAGLGDVPELTIEPGDADLSSIGADVAITTIQVTLLCCCCELGVSFRRGRSGLAAFVGGVRKSGESRTLGAR